MKILGINYLSESAVALIDNGKLKYAISEERLNRKKNWWGNPYRSIDYVLKQLSLRNILGGYDLTSDFPQLKNSLLVCVTETKTDEDITIFAEN